MKKNITIILLLLVAFLVPDFAFAYENNIWSTDEVIKKTTSEGLLVEESIDFNCTDEWRGMCFAGSYVYNVTFTIPEDYEEESVVIAPELVAAFNSSQLFDQAMAVPGNVIEMNVKIINNSKYEYNYDNASFVIYPDNVNVPDYKRTTSVEEDVTFDGKTTDKIDTVYRVCNTAVDSLFPNCNKDDNTRGEYLSDEVLGAKLIEIGYVNGIEDLDEYYLDFYNEKYGTNYDSLSKFPKFILRDVFGQNDALYNLKDIWKSIGINGTGFPLYGLSGYSSYSDDMAKIENKVNELGFDSIASFVLDYINNAEGTSYSDLGQLSHEIQNKYFTYYGNESSFRGVLETNATLKAVSYDFFYNELLTFEFGDNSDKQDTPNDLAIGEYMRDYEKGDEEIIASAGKLSSGGTYELSDNSLRVNGPFTVNSYQKYNFNIHMDWTYSVVKGTVIVKYVDFSTNEEFESTMEVLSDMVGKTYTTTQKDFEGYTFLGVDGDTTGKYIDGTIVVIYYYDKNIGTGDVEEIPPQTGYNANDINISYYTYNVLCKKEDE